MQQSTPAAARPTMGCPCTKMSATADSTKVDSGPGGGGQGVLPGVDDVASIVGDAAANADVRFPRLVTAKEWPKTKLQVRIR